MEFVLVDFKLVLYLDYKVKKIILLTNNKSHFFTPHPRQCCLPEVKHVEKKALRAARVYAVRAQRRYLLGQFIHCNRRLRRSIACETRRTIIPSDSAISSVCVGRFGCKNKDLPASDAGRSLSERRIQTAISFLFLSKGRVFR